MTYFYSAWVSPAIGKVCLRLMLVMLLSPAVMLFAVGSGGAGTDSSSNGISLADYHARLQGLDVLLAQCQGGMNAANCRSNEVGPDFQVTIGAGKRQIRLGWLRSLLDEAAKGPVVGKPAVPATKSVPLTGPIAVRPLQRTFVLPTLTQRLDDARKRLAEDGRWVDEAAGSSRAKAAPSAQRAAIAQILAAKEYHAAVRQPSLMDRALEKVGNWINHVIEDLASAGSKSRWLGLAAEIGFVVLLCVGLVWLLIRLERQGRVGFTLGRPGVGEGAASARDWQLWLADARKAAANGDWREAIHLTYWASISRLESSGLWSADRARTPREYLALLSETSDKRPDLALLTRSFERTWYAGRPAGEAEFLQAEQLAGRLGAR